MVLLLFVSRFRGRDRPPHAARALRAALFGLAFASFGTDPSPAQSAATPTDRLAAVSLEGPGGEVWTVLYDVASSRLAAYRSKGQGLELRGARDLTWDLQLEEFDSGKLSARTSVSVADVRQAVQRARRYAERGSGAEKTSGARKRAPSEKKPASEKTPVPEKTAASETEAEGCRAERKEAPEATREPSAGAPAAGGENGRGPQGPAILTGARGPGGELWVSVYDLGLEKLASYRVLARGIELAGVRRVTWDLRLVEFGAAGDRSPSVGEVRAGAGR
ncbi:MAG: hypothetical protein ACUVYA_19035 [Planctomycetota bacterium]